MSSHSNRRKRNAKAKQRQANAARYKAKDWKIMEVGSMFAEPKPSPFRERVNALIARWSYKPTWKIWARGVQHSISFGSLSGEKAKLPSETGVVTPKSVPIPEHLKHEDTLDLLIRADVVPTKDGGQQFMMNDDGTFTLQGATVKVHSEMDDEEIFYQMWRLVKDLEDHEMDEFFLVDDKRHYNPHKPAFHELTYWDKQHVKEAA